MYRIGDCWEAHGAGELEPLDLNPELRERRPTPAHTTAASATGGDALGAEEGEDGGGWVPFGDTRVGIVPAIATGDSVVVKPSRMAKGTWQR